MSRPTSHLRGPSLSSQAFYQQAQNSNISSTSNSNAPLIARINEKKVELENLMQLKELSGTLAKQMEQLEAQLQLLSDGTEAVAVVLANWNSILRAMSMASQGLLKPAEGEPREEGKLPTTLVRIPVNKNG